MNRALNPFFDTRHRTTLYYSLHRGIGLQRTSNKLQRACRRMSTHPAPGMDTVRGGHCTAGIFDGSCSARGSSPKVLTPEITAFLMSGWAFAAPQGNFHGGYRLQVRHAKRGAIPCAVLTADDEVQTKGRRQSERIVPDRLASVDRAPRAKAFGPKRPSLSEWSGDNSRGTTRAASLRPPRA